MSQENTKMNITPELLFKIFMDPTKMIVKEPWATREIESGRARLLGSIENDEDFFILERV